ncbi:hypothetical protein DM01DRAFT_159426 [Hesseltinella vesiculosa]|uniref:Secreted protein n=1 Tax=Hesseltinella vesiculosa TaxID=101127 RepID=A0A1X2GSC2_9FUNG|nr:hypothetical protein DM01DRAFT_159426 [Hesseltinella vesiculosa]
MTATLVSGSIFTFLLSFYFHSSRIACLSGSIKEKLAFDLHHERGASDWPHSFTVTIFLFYKKAALVNNPFFSSSSDHITT